MVAFYIGHLLIKRIRQGDSNGSEYKFQQHKLETHRTHFAYQLIPLDSKFVLSIDRVDRQRRTSGQQFFALYKQDSFYWLTRHDI